MGTLVSSNHVVVVVVRHRLQDPTRDYFSQSVDTPACRTAMIAAGATGHPSQRSVARCPAARQTSKDANDFDPLTVHNSLTRLRIVGFVSAVSCGNLSVGNHTEYQRQLGSNTVVACKIKKFKLFRFHRTPVDKTFCSRTVC